MKLSNYLNESVSVTKMYDDLVREFVASHPTYKIISPEKLMKDLEKFDYKGLVALLDVANVATPKDFIKKYKKLF